ncbi:MAG: cobalt-precorrin-5B (C(1))-methyltransferase CbiD [Alphaproteobacteria bacterium]|nr:cobalt-precorrin-5B (C(1))-methyltransferase CbiD [Alphaproteobacteria bacterium]
MAENTLSHPRAASGQTLRRGWTTGACAAAAAKAAYLAILSNKIPDAIRISLPAKSQEVDFALAECAIITPHQAARATVIKDAGDDPDITHGVRIEAIITCQTRETTHARLFHPDSSHAADNGAALGGVKFIAGAGVGTVTRPGLALAVGEPAINPVPRRMIEFELSALAAAWDDANFPNLSVEIGIAGGAQLAEKTLNPRLGIMGGLSILGTTGIVIPYSCSAWIHSIQRGIDVARASGITHIAGATGRESERKIQQHYNLPDMAIIDMGDFVGGMLSYLRRHPVARVTIAGKFGKLVKLAQGHFDLHSGRSRVDLDLLRGELADIGVDVAPLAAAQSAAELLALAGDRNNPSSDAAKIAEFVSEKARMVAQNRVGLESKIELVMF